MTDATSQFKILKESFASANQTPEFYEKLQKLKVNLIYTSICVYLQMYFLTNGVTAVSCPNQETLIMLCEIMEMGAFIELQNDNFNEFDVNVAQLQSIYLDQQQL